MNRKSHPRPGPPQAGLDKNPEWSISTEYYALNVEPLTNVLAYYILLPTCKHPSPQAPDRWLPPNLKGCFVVLATSNEKFNTLSVSRYFNAMLMVSSWYRKMHSATIMPSSPGAYLPFRSSQANDPMARSSFRLFCYGVVSRSCKHSLLFGLTLCQLSILEPTCTNEN